MHVHLGRRDGRWVALRGRFLSLALLGMVVVGTGTGSICAAFADSGPRADYRAMALETQRYTWHHLAYTGGAANCASARYVSYRRDDRSDTTISDHWYSALQVRADAALVRLGEEHYRCQVDKAVAWMELLWSPDHRGYAPRANLDGSNPTLHDVYADDNGVIGLAFLEAARVTRDPAVRERSLDGARRAAGFMVDTGLWDGTFGGGLWWTNQRENLGEGKPALPTALLAQLTAELYVETREPAFRQHALDSLDWLDRTLWSPYHQMYAYGINFAPGDPSRAVVADEAYFGYDQAIVIEALLALHSVEPGDGRYLARARQIGRAINRYFWHPELGGYTLQASVLDLYAPYGAWISEALVDLYRADGNPFWRDRAQANLDALARTFGNGEGGYYRLAFKCEGEREALCRRGEEYGLERVVYTMSQATMQRAAALLAAAH
ncbi:MAG: hypothetical protein M3O34_03960 [Chloroflexota bacterium]|nr:hypothetical protein [Chloroflexota bacterium]